MNEIDRDFIRRVDKALTAGQTYQQIADAEGVPLNTLYYRVRSLGYKTAKRLVPVHAPAIDTDEVAA